MRERIIFYITVLSALCIAFWKEPLLTTLVMTAIGAIAGIAFDAIGIHLKFWSYPTASFLSKRYYMFVMPAWSAFTLVINSAWNVIPSWWLAFLGVTVGLMLISELPNIRRQWWSYHAPAWVVVAGWFPLVLGFRAIYILVH